MDSQTLDGLAQAVLGIHDSMYGASTQEARASMTGDDLIVVLDGLELQRHERFLVESGRSDLVLRTRHEFQRAVGASFVAAVERASGRKVDAFLSTSHIDPSFSVEIFRLAPRAVL